MANKLNARLLLPRQVREDEDIASEINSYADFDHVPQGYMLRQIIRLGLEQKRRQLGEETVGLLRQLRSTVPAIPGPKSTGVTSSQPASRKMA